LDFPYSYRASMHARCDAHKPNEKTTMEIKSKRRKIIAMP
jgi:hypothetical protein